MVENGLGTRSEMMSHQETLGRQRLQYCSTPTTQPRFIAFTTAMLVTIKNLYSVSVMVFVEKKYMNKYQNLLLQL